MQANVEKANLAIGSDVTLAITARSDWVGSRWVARMFTSVLDDHLMYVDREVVMSYNINSTVQRIHTIYTIVDTF